MNDYETGYKKPPKKSRYKAGQSGNPKGRPKRYQSLKADLLDELQEPVTITESGKTHKVSKQRVFVKQTMAKTLGGDLASAKLLVNMMQKHLPEEPEVANGIAPILPQEDAELLAYYTQTQGDV